MTSVEVDIFRDLIFFFFFTTWTEMAAEDSETMREQEGRSLHGLLYCSSNPAWVKFLWFRRNFTLGREKKASCFQKLGALISLRGWNPEEMKVHDLISRAQGVVSSKRGVGRGTVHHLLTIRGPGCLASPRVRL